MVFSIGEIIDAIIMSLAVGFIYTKAFSVHARHDDEYDPLKDKFGGFDWRAFWFTVAITAPSFVFHELAHKIVATLFGSHATFYGACSVQRLDAILGFPCNIMILGFVLVFFSFPFVFVIPGYVSHTFVSPEASILIAFAGPFLNLVLWLGAFSLYHFKIVKKKKYIPLLILTSKINMFLFIFNMMPLPIFDGFKVYEGLFRMFFG